MGLRIFSRAGYSAAHMVFMSGLAAAGLAILPKAFAQSGDLVVQNAPSPNVKPSDDMCRAGVGGIDGETAQVLGVEDNFDITLVDGRKLSLVGVALYGGQSTREKLSMWLIGATVAIQPLARGLDRWGRLSARIGVVQGAPPRSMDVAEAVLDAGLGLYRPAQSAHQCRAGLLAAEENARKAGIGVWASGGQAIIAATDRKALAAAPPGLTLVEGPVVNVGETMGRYYLNFGAIRGVDFSLVIPKRNIAALTMLELGKASTSGQMHLSGQILRVRGLIDRRFGPQMELSDVDALEKIGSARDAGAHQLK